MDVLSFQNIRETALTAARQAQQDVQQELPQPQFPGSDFGGGIRPRGQRANFGEAFKQAVDKVDLDQRVANDQVSAFIAGEQENVHEVVISMNKAQLSFQLMTEVRNRMLETYQELMRMQI